MPRPLCAAILAVTLVAGCSRASSQVAAAPAPPALEFAGEWGVRGQAPGQLDKPAGLAVDVDERVFLPDRGTGFLQKFTLGGVPLQSFEDSAILGAAGIAVDSGGGIYVADARAGQIHVFFPEGDPLRVLHVAPQPRFDGPFTFSADADGNLFVPDPAGARIQVLSPKGQLLRSWRIAIAPAGGQVHPVAAVVGPDGFLYVGDSASGRIWKFSRTGERVAVWNDSSAAGRTQGLAVSPEYVFVLRDASPRLEAWTLDGKRELADDLGGHLDAGSQAVSLAWAAGGELLVLDAAAPRVLRFRVHLGQP
jgi:sugar lactone lactonase YvrE